MAEKPPYGELVTDRNLSEEVLKKMEWYLRSMLDGLVTHITVLDDRGEIILTNKAYRDFGEQNGIDPRTVSEGINYLSVCDTASGEHSKEAAPFAAGIREVLSGKRPSFELEYPCHSPGENRWFVGHVTPFVGEGPQRVVVAHENITERKQAEEKLKESQTKYKLIAENMADIITTMDMDLNFTYVSPSVTKLRGFTVEEALQQKIDQIMTSESFQCLSTVFAEELILEQTGTADPDRVRIIELEEYKKDGSTTWVENTASFIRDSDQKPIGILAISRDITDRKRDEAEKAQLLAQLQTTLDATADGILVVNHEGKIVTFNKRFVKFWEIPEIILETGDRDKSLSYIIEKLEDPDGFLARVRHLYANPTEKSFDTITLKDGRIFERYSRPHVLHGDIIGRVWSFRDVTKRHKAENALRQSEKKYRQLVKNAPAGLYEIDFVSNKITMVNDVACQYTGHTKQQLLEMNPFDLLTPKSAQLFTERLQRMFAGENVPENVEYQIRKKDGSTIWAEMNVQLRYEEETVRGAAVVVHDITKRKRAEIKVSTAKKQWEDTFDAISDWVSIIDKNHTIIRSNSASNSFFGFSPNQITGRCCHEIVHGANCPIDGCPGSRAFKTRQRESMELQLEDGRWFRVIVDPMGGNPEGPEHFVHLVRDITDFKKQEIDRISARKSKAFSLLSGGIAHDFNNLLSIIMGNISVMRNGLTESFYQEILEDIENACEQSKNLTHQFLTLSEGWGMDKSPCDIKSILQSAIDDVLQIRQVTISLDINSSHTTLKGDRSKLQTAFYNIILNAAEAMTETGGLCIQVSLTSEFSGMGGQQSGIQIVFTDTGKGIDPGDIPNIFDPYFSSKQLGNQKGRGLGLSLAKAIITKHGGDIVVDSASGKGTTVSVYLPVSTFKTDTVSKQIQALPPGKPIVLLMEDEPSLQKMCKRILEGFGFGVLAASSAKETFALFDHAGRNDMAIELLIFDQAVTGDMGGAETLKELRIAGFDGKAIIVSGSPGSPDMTDYHVYGFDDRILKPYTKNDIKQVIDAVLTR